MQFQAPLNHESVQQRHNWLIVNTAKRRLVESHWGRKPAERGVAILNRHSKINGCGEPYELRERSQLREVTTRLGYTIWEDINGDAAESGEDGAQREQPDIPG